MRILQRQVWAWSVVLGLAIGVSVAQAPAIPQPTASQQELIRAAAEAESTAARELQLAQANYRATQAKTLQIIYQTMAEQKLSPAEYTWKAENGKLVFVRLPEKKDGKQ